MVYQWNEKTLVVIISPKTSVILSDLSDLTPCASALDFLTWFFVYFELDFYCLCYTSWQKSSAKWTKNQVQKLSSKIKFVHQVQMVSDLCKKTIQQPQEYWFSPKFHKVNITSCKDLSIKILFILWMWVEKNNSYFSAGFYILIIVFIIHLRHNNCQHCCRPIGWIEA